MNSALIEVQEQARQINPLPAAQNCSVEYKGTEENGLFRIPFLNETIELTFPGLKVSLEGSNNVDAGVQIILSYHLIKSDGRALTNNWISYADLPGGMDYIKAMRSYSSELLQKHFGNDIDKLSASARKLGALDLDLSADLAVKFSVFPKVPVALLYWCADEEFPTTRADFLFDEAAPHHLPSDCYAILCSYLTQSLISN